MNDLPPRLPPPLPQPIGKLPDDPNAGWLVRHLRRHERRAPGNYLWRVSLEGFLVAAIVSVFASVLGIEGRHFKPSQFGTLALSAIAIAPVLETILFQMLPVGVVRVCGGSRRVQMATSILHFAIPHFLIAPGGGLAAGLVGGFYFAFTYTHWRRRSLARAYWMTAAQHTAHNGMAIAIVAVAQS